LSCECFVNTLGLSAADLAFQDVFGTKDGGELRGDGKHQQAHPSGPLLEIPTGGKLRV